jgi:hypothetical protein
MMIQRYSKSLSAGKRREPTQVSCIVPVPVPFVHRGSSMYEKVFLGCHKFKRSDVPLDVRMCCTRRGRSHRAPILAPVILVFCPKLRTSGREAALQTRACEAPERRPKNNHFQVHGWHACKIVMQERERCYPGIYRLQKLRIRSAAIV